MEPFSISCTTCQARLRVRDVSAIGQILTCPRCGSMVLVEAPHSAPGQAAAHPEGHEPHAAVQRPPPLPPDPAKTQNASDTVDDPTHYGLVSDPQPSSHTSEEIRFEPAAGGVDAAAEGTAEAVEGGAVSLDAAWQTDDAARRRRWLLAALASVAGVLLALAVFAFLVNRSPVVADRPPGTVDVPGSSALTGKVVDANSTVPPGTEAVEMDPGRLPEGAADSPSGLLPEPAADSSTAGPATPPEGGITGDSTSMGANTTVPATEPPGTVPPDTVLTGTGVAPAPGGVAIEPTKLASGGGATPPDLTPPDLKPPSSTAAADRMTPGGGLSETLRKLGGLFDDPESPASGDAGPATSAPVESTPSAAPVSDARERLSRPARRTVDMAARLADPVQEIQFNVPLQDFLQFVTNYSTIPITLDPDILVWLNLTADAPVDVRMSNTSVEELLGAVLPKMGLAAIPTGNQLFVTRATIGDGKPRTARRPVSDLLSEDPAAAERIADFVRSLIAPGSWAGAGGEGTVTVADGTLEMRQTDAIVLEVSAFLERLRVARGLPKKSHFDERYFRPISRTARGAPQLAKRVTLNYPRPTSFPRVVRRLAQESSTAILIDWQSLDTAGWNPDAEVTLTVADQSLGDALHALLKPMELTFRIVDESTFQITTPAQLDERSEVEFYPVGTLLDGGLEIDALQQRIREAMMEDGEDRGVPTMKWDVASRCLLLLDSQPRQQALERLLQSWRTVEK